MTHVQVTAVLSSMLAVGAVALTPLACTAADGDSDAVGFVAQSTSLTPVQVVGGSGLFQFATTFGFGSTCMGVSSDEPASANFACSISASGSYTSIACGTGTLSGSASVSESGDGQSDSVSFAITLVGGVGVITGGATGVALIVPTGAATPPACMTSFTIAGVVASS
jgi:hypothetical protein